MNRPSHVYTHGCVISVKKTEDEIQKLDKDKAKEEFKLFKYWRNYKVNWHDLYAEKKLP
jgi:hypothetical protein